jgi:glycerol-3-phosphate dehydrogenase
VAVIGAGVVGSATALGLARRGVATILLEAEDAPALGASGTNSGILHTGFDSPPGELETRMLLASARLRAALVEALGVPVIRCGAVMHAADPAAASALARGNGVTVTERGDGALEIPGEAVTDPVRFTLALAAGAQRHGAQLLTGSRVDGIEHAGNRLRLHTNDGERIVCSAAVNSAGLHADAVARLVGDESFEIYPRKGEFLVFEPPPGEALSRILLPTHTARTRGVLVFPTVDGMVVAGPTAIDQQDKLDWSVRPEAAGEIVPLASALYPPLEGARQIGAYAGLRPAGRGVNYLIGPSRACRRVVNVAAIRSTGLSASLGIAEHVAGMIASLDIPLAPVRELVPGAPPVLDGPWWRRASDHWVGR